MDAVIAILVQSVWPLLFLLLALLVLRQVSDQIHPIVVGMVSGLAKSAASNAQAYAIALLFGLSASLSAFVDVFKDMNREAIMALSWHQYLVLVAKVANPFIVAILAYATQNKFKGGNTQPPLTQ